jgi:hypothetical protein
VFDATGRRVRALAPGSATWDLHDDAGARVPAGVYWLRAVPLLGTNLPVPRPTRVVVLP